MDAIRMKTEYLYNPVGIDVARPRFFWNCSEGRKQTAYRIVAKNDEGEVLWDSERVNSNSMRAEFGGKALPSGARVIWSICLWDEDGNPGQWQQAFFETGITEWQGSWITGNYRVDKRKRYPVDYFQKIFTADHIKKARLYITACGVYEACLNRQKIGDYVLAPGITDYRKRVQYQTYDVTELLREGENRLTVALADGWYRGSCGAWGRRNQYGTETKFLAQLVIEQENGEKKCICSDQSWDWSGDGPILFADNKDGEVVDARRTPSFGMKAKATGHPVVPTASNNVPVREHEHFSAQLLRTPSGKTVLDFGQNIAGYVSFSVKARDGEKIKLYFGEMLDAQGEFSQKNIQCSSKKLTTPLQRVIYTCRNGKNQYQTSFAIFGFRYVLVETEVAVKPENFTAIVVYSDMERTGFFECSNPLLNRFFDCTVWSAKNNSCDLPTDCPTRERHGWTGDAQIFCPTASMLFDYMSFGRKFLNDVYDWQKPNGKLPQIAPEGGTDPYMKAMDGCVGWADAGVIMPYVLWKQYGDEEVIRTYLAGMRKYVSFMKRRCGKWYITAKRTGLKKAERKFLSNYGQAYGEWAEPDDVHHMTWKDCAVPHPEVATAYTAYICCLMAEMEEALGNFEKAKENRSFAKGCKHSYQALVQTPDFSLDTDRQARLVRPLAFHLLDDEQTEYAQKRLMQALEHYGFRIGTGFLSTPLIMDVLTQIDVEAAYRLLENEEMPGWLYMPKMGATTVWEAWEGSEAKNGGIASLDHYSKGAVCRWLFDTMCGIRVDGENHFTIAPMPGGHFTYAKASYTSVYGTVSCGWTRENGQTEFVVTIPANCTARLLLPNGVTSEQQAGTVRYAVEKA